MSSLGTKTPVSCLQEYAVSKKMTIPRYELTYDGVGTHNPKFTYRVQVGLLWEEGTGRSKQEAKHRAAEKMLITLNVVESKPEEVETSELNKEATENFVGQLKDLCRTIHYPEPKYFLEEDAGPPHSRIFKMICCVSQLQDFGISKTRKQAKQQAAAKMLQLLKNVGGKKIEECLTSLESSNKVTDEEIVEKYNTLKSTNVTPCVDPAALYKDNHKAYIDLKETSSTLTKLLNECRITDFENSLSLLENIAKELSVELSTIEVPKKNVDIHFTIMTMSVCPSIGGVGLGRKEAAFNLLNSLLVLCKQ